MTIPDHAENTGDNLRHAAEVQEQAKNDATDAPVPPRQADDADPLPDFNT